MKLLKHHGIKGQPSQYTENESEDGYGIGTCTVITEYLPFVMIPFISYLTIVYAHPMISFYLKKYLQQKTDDSFSTKQDADLDEVKTKISKKWKVLHLECLFQASCIIYFLLIIRKLNIPSDHCNNVDKGFPLIVDHYIHTMLSFLMTIFLYAMMITGIFFKWRKISFTTVISMSISVNIIYMVCYFFPETLVSFTYDPVQATYTIFIAIIIFVPSYPFMWYYFLLLLFSRVFLEQAYFTSCSCKIMFMASAFCVLAIVFLPIIYLTSFSGYQYLLILHLMIALLVACVYKHIDNCAYKHIIVNELAILFVLNYETSWAEDNEEDNTISYTCTDQDFVSHSNFKGIKEIDVHLECYESTIV